MMKYKGYYANPQYSDDDGVFYGKLLGISDLITFEGQSVHELRKAFEEAVDDYLAWCKEDGVEPEQPFSEDIQIQLRPDVHAKAASAANEHGKSLNQWVTEVIESVVE